MLPAEHISMLDAGAAISDCLIAAHMDMHTRFPVTERPGDAQGIIGYVNFKDIVAHLKISPHDHSLRGILRQILSVQDSQPISHVLESMMKEHTHIALVRDSGGRVTGLITLEDIVEELIGDIQDEYDMLPWHVAPSGDGWVAGGGVSLTRLRELTGIDLSGNLPEEGIRNLSGWVIAHQQGPVRGGERLEQSGVRLIVRKVRRQRVLEAQISRITPTA
jgi:putative hemolysin